MRRIGLWKLSVLLGALFPLAVPGYGQLLKGTILGTVTDQSHAVVPSVSVDLTEISTNYHRTEVTNDSGFFAFANLDPGIYRIDIKHTGFKETRRDQIALDANTTVRTDFELAAGEITQIVEVSSEAAVLQTDRADTGGQVGSQQINDLALANQRNYQNTIVILPGATAGYRSNSPFFNSQESLQVPVNGLDRLNNFMIEGLDNNIEQDNNLTAVVLPADAIQQVMVSTSDYDPEFGRVGAAAVNVIMKSGSNAFHGSLFEYHNDSDLQARNFFATSVPHGIHNQFGASAGGHILRDKVFYFADFQGTKDIVGQIAIPTIPTAAMRTGDFAASPTIIYDPLTGNTATGAGRTPFAGQRIPASRISPIFQDYMTLLPEPTLGTLSNNIDVATDQTKDIYSFDTKIDWNINSKNTMFLRYSLAHLQVTNPGLYGPGLGIYGGPSNSGFDATGPALNQSPGLNYSHIFSPTLVTELRFGIVRNRNDATNVDTGTSLSQKFGIPNSNIGGFWYQGLAEVFVNGYDTPMIGVNGCLPWRRSNTNFEAANNWTKTKGTHVISWGGDWRHENYFLLQTATFSPRGRFTFTAGPTTTSGVANGFANSLAAFELDQPNGIGRDLAGISPVRDDHVYAAYVHDKWQVSPKLTLDIGARWEYWPASYPQFPGGQFNYDPNTNSLLAAGYGNIPMDLGVKNYPWNIYPRIGVAYRLDEKTVIRAGFGMSSFYRYIADWQGPVKQNQQLIAANSFVAAGSMATGFPTPTFFTIPSNGIITNAPNQNYTIVPPNVPVPYAETWNFTIQRMLPANLAFEVAYVGNHAVGIENTNVLTNNSYNINAATVAGKGAATEPENILFGRTATTAYPVYEGSHYDALQVKLNRRFANGFLMTTSYTFGKGIDYSPYNELGYAVYPGLTKYNRAHTFTYTATWQLPFGNGRKWANSGPAKYILGGWQIGGLWTWESGLPLLFASNSTTTNLAAALNAPGNQQWPEQVAPVQILGHEGPGQYWFSPSSFAFPAAGTIGNVGRDILYGPNLFTINASVSRQFNITERFKLTFRGEAFNLTNTPQFDQPDTTLGDVQFGQITTANQNAQSVKVNPNRLLQGSLRITF